MRNLYTRTSLPVPQEFVFVNKVETDILNNLRHEYNAMSVSQLSYRNSVSRRTVHRHLKRLIDIGLVEKRPKNVNSS